MRKLVLAAAVMLSVIPFLSGGSADAMGYGNYGSRVVGACGWSYRFVDLANGKPQAFTQLTSKADSNHVCSLWEIEVDYKNTDNSTGGFIREGSASDPSMSLAVNDTFSATYSDASATANGGVWYFQSTDSNLCTITVGVDTTNGDGYTNGHVFALSATDSSGTPCTPI